MRPHDAPFRTAFAVAVSFVLAAPTSAYAQHFRVTRLSLQLFAPWETARIPGDDPYLYIVQGRDGVFLKHASIKVFDTQSRRMLTQPFITIDGLNGTGAEDNLRGMAFDPNFEDNGFFYLHYAKAGNISTISRFHATDRLAADPATEQVLLQYPRTSADHHSGDIEFGHDGMLYIASGDDVSQFDAQKLNSYNGKILRIDVRGDDFPENPDRNYAIPADNPFVENPEALPEIWAYGVRNPWNLRFDSATGDMYLADVGERGWEEVNFHKFGDSGGMNFGWSVFEGTHCYNGGIHTNPSCAETEQTPPAYEYPHEGPRTIQGTAAIIGAAPYRGPIAELQGKYIFSDFVDDTHFALEIDRETGKYKPDTLFDLTRRLVPDVGQPIKDVLTFGEDAAGNLYIFTQGQAMYVVDGLLLPGDASLNGAVGIEDFNLLKQHFGQSESVTFRMGDFDADGLIALSDFNILKVHFGQSPSEAAVPEPSSWLLVVLTIVFAIPIARRSREPIPSV